MAEATYSECRIGGVVNREQVDKCAHEEVEEINLDLLAAHGRLRAGDDIRQSPSRVLQHSDGVRRNGRCDCVDDTIDTIRSANSAMPVVLPRRLFRQITRFGLCQTTRDILETRLENLPMHRINITRFITKHAGLM